MLMCSAGNMISRTVRLENRAAPRMMPSSRSPISRDARAEAAWARSSSSSTASDLAPGWIRGRQRRSLQASIVETQVSNNHTAGQTLKQNHRISGESRRQTHSLLRSENTFGISSPKMMVKNVKGRTIAAMARTIAAACERPSRWCRNGSMLWAAPSPPMAAAIAASSVTATCMAARLPSMFCFMCSAALAPARFSRTKTWSRATVTAAKAIS